jgi:hypothetical protein
MGSLGEQLLQVSEIVLTDPNACEDDDDAVSGFGGGCAAAIALLGCDFVFDGSPISDYCLLSCNEI